MNMIITMTPPPAAPVQPPAEQTPAAGSTPIQTETISPSQNAPQTGQSFGAPAGSSQNPVQPDQKPSAPAENRDPSAAGPAEETPKKPDAGTVTGPVLQIEQKGRHIRLQLHHQVDWSESVLFLDGRRLDSPEFDLPQDGEYLLSWQICDAQGRVLESSEKSLQADTLAPVIQASTEGETLWITDERELSFIISDQSEFVWETFVDGISQGQTDRVRLHRDNRTVSVVARDEHGHQSAKTIRIQALPRVLSDWASEPLVHVHDGRLQMELDEGWQGCVLQVKKNGLLLELPFVSSSMEVNLPLEGQMTLELKHPAYGTLGSWQVCTEESQTSSAETAPVPEQPAPEQEAPVPMVPEKESGESPLPQKPAIPSGSPFPDPEKADPAEPAESAKSQESLTSSIVQPLPALEIWSGQEKVLDQQRIYLPSLQEADLEVRNGTLEKMSFLANGQPTDCTSLQEVLQAHPDAVITASIEARDLARQTVIQEIEVASLPQSVSSAIAAMNSTRHAEFDLDSQGRLQVKTSSETRNLTSSITDGDGTTWKWYGFDPATMEVFVNDEKIENPATGTSFFGSTYVELSVQGPALIQIQQDGHLLHSEVLSASGQSSQVMQDSENLPDLSLPILAILAFLGSLPLIRLLRRRKAGQQP